MSFLIGDNFLSIKVKAHKEMNFHKQTSKIDLIIYLIY